MNKNELISDIASRTDLTKDQAGDALDAAINAITDSMKKGEEVRLLGFGNFSVSHRAAKKGRNPRTGEEVDIKAANVPKFKPGKGLKDALN